MDDPFPIGMMPDIKEFFHEYGDLPPGRLVYDEVFARPYFFPLQRQEEMRWMMRKAGEYSPQVIYEIGADKGGGLFHWCKSIETVCKVIACEIRGTPYKHLFEEHFPHIEFLWIEASSYSDESVRRVIDFLNGDPIDVLFIDGDKQNFETDFNRMRPLMRDPSVVFMHDIQDALLDRQFRVACLHVPKNQRFIDISDAEAAMDRERRGLTAASAHEGWLRHWRGRSCGVGALYLNGD